MGRRELAMGRRRVPPRPAELADIGVAFVLLVGAMWAVSTLRHDQTVLPTVLGAALCTTAVGWRRYAPVPAALTSFAGVALYQVSGHDTQGAFVSLAVVLTSYLVGRASDSWRPVLLVGAVGLVAVGTIQADAGFSFGATAMTWLMVAVAPMAAGRIVRGRVVLVQRLQQARACLQGERDLVEARALTEERSRIARELHDAIAHCVSVMVIQAGAARLLLESQPADAAAARPALRIVASSGREALADIRRMVGVRQEDEMSTPRTGLAQLPRLADRARLAGSAVQLRLDVRVQLPEDMELAIFRIVQEALTNVARYAPGASVSVSVSAGSDAVEIDVTDTGSAATATAATAGPVADGSGHGLVGMRERAAVYGGSLRATPLASGGFEVRAHWPTIASAAADPPGAPISAKESLADRRLTPRRLDLLLSAGWLVALEVAAVTSPDRSGPLWLNLIAVAGMASAAMFRRRAPLLFVVAVGAIAIALSGGVAAPDRASVVAAYPLLMGGYAAAAYSPLRRAMVGLAVLLAGLVVANVLQHSAPGTVFGGALMSCVVWLVGRVVRDQRELATQLRAANRRLESERDIRAAFVVEAERLRIAEDLQAIVARAVALMVLQAENAEMLLGDDPVRAGPALAAIENTGRQTLTHLRRILGILRSPREPAPRSPSLTAQLPDAIPVGEPS